MNRVINYIAVFCVSVSSLLPSAAYATEFDPNFLLSDEELTDARAMNRADIQAFLESHGGALSKVKVPDKEGAKRPASYIIDRASREHDINPKYLLIKLQKEQSLITEKTPTQKQLDGATGYGITDGCGWSCSTYLNNKGFGKQVDSAAAIMRWYYDNLHKESWIKRKGKSYAIDSTTVRPATNATGFLYTYTPHIQGNRNFWKLWQKWFDQLYPDGSLLKAAEESTVYLIRNGERRPIESMSALMSRFDPDLIIHVPKSELSNYKAGPAISLPNFAVIKVGVEHYLVDGDRLRRFVDAGVVKKLGYHPDEIVEVTKKDIAGYVIDPISVTLYDSHPLGRLVRLKENNKLYYLENGTYTPIFDEEIAKNRLAHLDIESASASVLGDYPHRADPLLFKDGTLFGVTGSNKIYVVANGKKRHIASEAVFNGLSYDWNNIVWVNQFAGDAHQYGEPIYLRRAVAGTAPITAGIQETNSEPENDIAALMVRTPADSVSFIGPTFDTHVNAYLIADYNSGEVLAGKNIDYPRPLASLTKVLTAYRLFKEGLGAQNTVTYSAAKHKAPYHRFRIAEGERYRNDSLLDAMLISSLNTPAKMLVSGIENNESAFVERMNKQLVDWGLSQTKIVDPAGVEIDNETTAREYLQIFTKSTKNGNVRRKLGKKSYRYTEVKDIDGKPDHFDNHSNDLMHTTKSYTILASKTGYLYESGANLAMLIRRNSDQKTFVILTMGNVDHENRFVEPEKIVDWAISQF